MASLGQALKAGGVLPRSHRLWETALAMETVLTSNLTTAPLP
jgi:hypothetical protein